MNKYDLCKAIGNFFGQFFEEAGQLCIDNGDTVYRYDTPEALLIDWLPTLEENPDGWEAEIQFIRSIVSVVPNHSN